MAKKIVVDVEFNGLDSASKKVGDIVEETKTLKQQFRDSQKEMQTLAGADIIDQKALEEAIAKTAKLKDSMNDVNEQVGVLAAGSPFEKMANSLGDVGSKIASLDFEGANESAQRMVRISKELTFKESAKSVINLTGTFFNLGKALLTNPIFLIAAAVVAISTAIAALLNKLGVLKPLINAIGKAFEWIGGVIDAVVQSIKDFTDWLGMTNNAAEEAAQKQADAAEKTAAAYEEKSARVIQGIDQEIRMNELSGKSTEGLERKKVYWLMKTAEARAKADRMAFQSARMKGELDAEELKALEDKYKASQLAYKQTINDVKYFEASLKKEKDDARKKEKEAQANADKEAADKARENRKKAIAEQKQYRADRLAADRALEDLRLENMQDGLEKEIAINKEKYKRLIEDTINNEKLLESEKEAIIAQYKIQRTASEEKIREEESKKAEEKAKEDAENLKSFNQQLTQLKIQNIKDENEKLRKELTNEYELQRQAILDNEKLTGEQKQALIDQINETEKQAKAKLEEEITAKKKEEEEKRKENRINAHLTNLEFSKKVADATIGFTEGVFAITNRLGKQDEKSQEQRARRQFAVNKALNLSTAVITGIQTTMEAFKNGMKNPIPLLGPATAGVYAGIAAAVSLGNIAKIAATKFETKSGSPSTSSGGGAGSGAAGSIPTPQLNAGALFSTGGQSTQMITSNQQAVVAPQAPIKAYVVEQEITGTQQRMSNIKQQASI